MKPTGNAKTLRFNGNLWHIMRIYSQIEYTNGMWIMCITLWKKLKFAVNTARFFAKPVDNSVNSSYFMHRLCKKCYKYCILCGK